MLTAFHNDEYESRLSAFHENEYVADDCPMVHGVFRSSRLRLFEDELGSRPGFELSEASLMRHRHNVYSEVRLQLAACLLAWPFRNFCKAGCSVCPKSALLPA